MTKKYVVVKEGDRILLKADEEQGWAEEYGTALNDSPGDGTCIIVRLDPEYADLADDDDLLREVEPTEDYVKVVRRAGHLF